jgi:hypothetical protein
LNDTKKDREKQVYQKNRKKPRNMTKFLKLRSITELREGKKNVQYLFSPDSSFLVQIVSYKTYNDNLLVLIKRVIFGLKGNLKCVIIYKELNELLYSYLYISSNGKHLMINCETYIAIKLAKLLNAKIVISEPVLNKVGIKITKEMLIPILR